MASESAAPGTGEYPAEVDTLIHARWLLPMAPPGAILAHHSLAVKGERIAAILPTAEAKQRLRARREYTLDSHVLQPGLVNAHGHSPMTLLRGYADDMPLHAWLEQRIWPAEKRWVNEEFVEDGARLAVAEMLLGGITCFSDMYFFPDHVARVALETRIRVQLASPVLDFPTVWGESTREYIRKATELHDEYRKSAFVSVAFGPHSAYLVAEEALRKIAMLAEELDIPVHIHLHENAQEVDEAFRRHGGRHIARLEAFGLLGPRLQAVHMTQLSEREIEQLAAFGVHVVHCPASNLKLASGFCPAASLLHAGVNVCLGTDGAASNNQLDLLHDMRLAALAAKGSLGDASALDAWQALAMATLNGARALGLDADIGSLERGKFADCIAVDLGRPNTQPVYDPASTLVYSASSSQVSHVWVGGQLSVENGKLRGLDLAYLLDKAQHWADRIAAPELRTVGDGEAIEGPAGS